MEHVDYVYTVGMTDAELEDQLRTSERGVLGLADCDDAYAIPLSFHYDGDRLLFRVSRHDDESEKQQFLEATDRATFVCYEGSMKESRSIQVRGPSGSGRETSTRRRSTSGSRRSDCSTRRSITSNSPCTNSGWTRPSVGRPPNRSQTAPRSEPERRPASP